VGRTARSLSIAPNPHDTTRRTTRATSIAPNDNELIEDKWAGRRARTMSVAQPQEPPSVDKLIADNFNTYAELRTSDHVANKYAEEATPLFEATEWLKKSLLDLTDNSGLQRRVKQLLGSQNFLTNLSTDAWADLQKYCEDEALSLGMSMEEFLKKADLVVVIRNGLNSMFVSAYGKPRHTDLFLSPEDAKHRYEVIPDERAQHRGTVWGDQKPFLFDIRQDLVIHSCHQFMRDESKSQLWNEKAYIHCLRMVAMAVDLRFQSDVESVCKKAGGKIIKGPIKEFERMKIECTTIHSKERFPRPANNLDVNRNRSVFDNADQMLTFAKGLKEHSRFGNQPVRVENTFTDDDGIAREKFYHRVVKFNWLYTPGICYKDLLDSHLSELWDRYFDYESVPGCGVKDPDEPWDQWRDQIGLALEYLKSDGLADEQVQIIVETEMLLRPYIETQEKTQLLCKICQSPSAKALYLEFSSEDHEISNKSYDEVQDAALEELVKFLEENKDVNRDVNVDRGASKLCLAAMNGHTKVVKKMMKIRAVDVNKPVWVTGATPLYLASQYGHAMCVKYLLENRNIRVNQSRTDEGEAAPLHIAAQNGHDEVMKLLLMSSGIKVNAVLTEGDRTALFVAAYYGHEKIVQYLLEHPQIRVNQATDDGATPLYIAAQQGHVDVVEELLKRDDIMVNSATTDEGRSPLSIACLLGRDDVVRQLLSHPSINVNQPTLTGATPLFMAAQEGHEEIVKMLLANKSIKVSQARTKDKATPLRIAQALKQDRIVDILEERGADKEKCLMM